MGEADRPGRLAADQAGHDGLLERLRQVRLAGGAGPCCGAASRRASSASVMSAPHTASASTRSRAGWSSCAQVGPDHLVQPGGLRGRARTGPRWCPGRSRPGRPRPGRPAAARTANSGWPAASSSTRRRTGPGQRPVWSKTRRSTIIRPIGGSTSRVWAWPDEHGQRFAGRVGPGGDQRRPAEGCGWPRPAAGAGSGWPRPGKCASSAHSTTGPAAHSSSTRSNAASAAAGRLPGLCRRADPGRGERLVPASLLGRQVDGPGRARRQRVQDLPGQEGLADARRALDDQAGSGRCAALDGIVDQLVSRLFCASPVCASPVWADPVDHVTRIIASGQPKQALLRLADA